MTYFNTVIRSVFFIALVVSCAPKPVASPEASKPVLESEKQQDEPVIAFTTVALALTKAEAGEGLSCEISLNKSDEDSPVQQTTLGVFDGPCTSVALTADNARNDIPDEILRIKCSPMNANGAATGSLFHIVNQDGELVVLESEYGGTMNSQSDPKKLTERNRLAIAIPNEIRVGPATGSCEHAE